MAGFIPAIHVLLCLYDVDARHKAGHDEAETIAVEGEGGSPTRQDPHHGT